MHYFETEAMMGRMDLPEFTYTLATALADVQARSGENAADFEKWLTATLERQREERRKALVSSMQGRKLPNLVLKDLQGNKVDLRAERGNVVLLNFFSAW